MNKIKFSSAFVVGHDAIDADHLELAELLNSMIDAVSQQNLQSCAELWPEFTAKLKSHFQMEEKIKGDFGFESVDADRLRSQEILNKLGTLSINCKTLTDWQNCLDEVAHNLMPFILRSDLPFGEHLIKIGYINMDKD